ncbi:MAG TPA: diguanylate cyclase [Myxococcota bacterium]
MLSRSGTRLLIVDDEEELCGVLARILNAKGYVAEIEPRATAAMERLRQRPYDAVLLDLFMPELSGIELLREIKAEFEDLPIVVLTGKGDLAIAVEAMQAGASDFISKPVEGAFLDLRIQRAIELEHARRLAKLDGLTGLYNHRFFQDRLGEEIKRSERHARPLALLLLDIDHFKDFNDRHGHRTGDAVLREVSRLLLESSRVEDIVARYGGEEFAMILPETACDGAEVFADRVKRIFEAGRLDDRSLPGGTRITVSIGVAGWKERTTKEGLLDAADSALYRAKREGRNRVCVAA